MTLESAAANYLVLLFGLAGFGVACAGIRAYQRDAYRQKAFTLRDQLFDFAAAGNVRFSDPAYWQLRLNMNRMIQYSHRLNFGEALLPMMVQRQRKAEPAESFLAWRDAIEEQPHPVRQEIERIHEEFQKITIVHLVLTTPLVWLCLLPFALMGTLKEAIQDLVKRAWVLEEEASRDAELRHARIA
jgi:hypothetical protein